MEDTGNQIELTEKHETDEECLDEMPKDINYLLIFFHIK